MYGLLANPWVAIALAFTLLTSHGFAYYKGWQSRDKDAKVELLKETQAKIEAMEAYDIASRELVKSYQKRQVETKVVYKTIKERVKDETIGRVCFNDRASRLWDNALEGILPETTTGTVGETSRTYTDEQVLANAVENFEQYKDCRSQLNSLIDWHENFLTN